ncbi:uncharacterized protein LOC133852722 [Alnus glutinosa]|uniref:uncharacterized protein LOC133852722 n=1 Tax=Alnus glutinosa TaxID=3517 RepID=UPI002D769322|nr:uncharacterized protein LOC133852722 [Alnus glutinosa]
MQTLSSHQEVSCDKEGLLPSDILRACSNSRAVFKDSGGSFSAIGVSLGGTSSIVDGVSTPLFPCPPLPPVLRDHVPFSPICSSHVSQPNSLELPPVVPDVSLHPSAAETVASTSGFLSVLGELHSGDGQLEVSGVYLWRILDRMMLWFLIPLLLAMLFSLPHISGNVRNKLAVHLRVLLIQLWLLAKGNRGLQNPRRVGRLFQRNLRLWRWLAPSLACRYESIKLELPRACYMDHVRHRIGFDSMFVVDPVGRSGGLALLWKEAHLLDIYNFSRFHINVVVKADGGIDPWRFTSFYGQPDSTRRMESWALLNHLKPLQPLPWRALEDCELCDLGYIGPQFTWTNGCSDANYTLERLDWGVANSAWFNLFQQASVTVLATSVSDHNPVLVSFAESMEERVLLRRSFKFEAGWMRDEDYGNLVQEAWTGGDFRWGTEIKKVQNEISDMLEREDMRWKQRAKQNWYVNGDRNTKYFQSWANQCRKSNSIRTQPRGVEDFLETLEPRVTEAMNRNLCRPFIEEEVQVAAPTRVTEYRPINLCNVLYKIISKVISNRLKDVLAHIISSEQSAFILGRLITDNVLVAFETLHTMDTRLKGKEGFMAMKLDMSKAYDRLEWDFLESIIRKLRFVDRWIHLIMSCLQTVSYSILLNGQPTGHIVPTRGIRQGDPLSPYLFIICAEGLSSMLKRSSREGAITGVPISRGGTRIQHLLFADDSLIFCPANCMERDHIHWLLGKYEEASGQQINRDKTGLFFSWNTKAAVQGNIVEGTGVSSTGCYEKYLGLPTLIGRSRVSTFNGINDRIWKRINGWKEKFLSHARKEILLKLVIQAIPTYTMSLFRLPRTLCREINSMMGRMWWGHKENLGKIPWMAWNGMGRGKLDGGLGYCDFISFNIAMLAKQAWRLTIFSESLVAKILREKYYPGKDFINSSVGSRPSYDWRSICFAKSLLNDGLIWRIGDGKKIKVKGDKWIPTTHSHKIQVPLPGISPEARVCDFIDYDLNWWNIP